MCGESGLDKVENLDWIECVENLDVEPGPNWIPFIDHSGAFVHPLVDAPKRKYPEMFPPGLFND